MENINSSNNNDQIDVVSLFKNYIKHWYIFAICIIACTGGAFLYYKLNKPVYQINANFLVSQDNEKGSNPQASLLKSFSFGSALGGGIVEDEIFIVSSHSMLYDAVKKLGLNKTYTIHRDFIRSVNIYQTQPVDIYIPSTLEDTLSKSLTFKIKASKNGIITVEAKRGRKKIGYKKTDKFPVSLSTVYGNFIFNKTQYFKEGKSLNMEITLAPFDEAAENVKQNIDIYLPDKKANVIGLSTKETNIQKGKDLLNTIINLYNSKGLIEKKQEALNTANFLDERINILTKELSNAEEEIETYKKANNLTDIGSEVKIILEQSGEFRSKLIETETQYQIIELIESFLHNPDNKYSLIPFNTKLSENSSPIEDYNELILKRIKLLRSVKENSPALQSLNEVIDATRNNVINSIKETKSSINITLNDLQKQENAFVSRIKNMPTQEREFISIKRQQVIKENLFLFLLQKKEENALTLASQTPKGQIIDQAYNQNKPVSLSKSMLLLIGLVLGLILPIIYLYLKDITRTKFSTKEELQKLTNLPILGEMCTNTSKDHIIVKEGQYSSGAELFRLIRTNIQFLLTNQNEKVILVTSSVSGEGKSFICSNFAASLALLGKKVILIGMDIRSPKLKEYLNIQQTDKKGVTNFLASNNLSLQEIIIPNAIQKNMDVILAGPIPPNPAELLLGNRIEELFSELKKEYDYIVVDSAPVGMVSDTFSLTRIADATIYICRANYTHKDNIKYVNNLVAEHKLKNVALIINGTPAKQGYGYGYGQTQKSQKI